MAHSHDPLQGDPGASSLRNRPLQPHSGADVCKALGLDVRVAGFDAGQGGFEDRGADRITADEGWRIADLIATAIQAAVYGPCGELRDRRSRE